MKKIVLLAAVVCTLWSCRKEEKLLADNSQIMQMQPVPENTLTPMEKKQGWKLLFDGKTLEGWHKYGSDSIGKAWVVDDNSIHLEVSDKKDWQTKNGGDILSSNEFENFYLT